MKKQILNAQLLKKNRLEIVQGDIFAYYNFGLILIIPLDELQSTIFCIVLSIFPSPSSFLVIGKE